MTEVQAHTRRTKYGTQHVHRYTRASDGAPWTPDDSSPGNAPGPGPGDTDPGEEKNRNKRERFEKRYQRETGGRPRNGRPPGERKRKKPKRRKKSPAQRSRDHRRKARRRYRRHKWKALGHLGMAGLWGAAHGAQKLRTKWQGRRR